MQWVWISVIPTCYPIKAHKVVTFFIPCNDIVTLLLQKKLEQHEKSEERKKLFWTFFHYRQYEPKETQKYQGPKEEVENIRIRIRKICGKRSQHWFL